MSVSFLPVALLAFPPPPADCAAWARVPMARCIPAARFSFTFTAWMAPYNLRPLPPPTAPSGRVRPAVSSSSSMTLRLKTEKGQEKGRGRTDKTNVHEKFTKKKKILENTCSDQAN